jgi:DNA-binding beta-propeller fold protein YncE
VVNSQVWIPNLNNSTLSRFNADGTSTGSPLSGNGLNAPEEATPIGTQIWVANNNANAVSLFNADGTSAGSPLTGNGLNQPHGIAAVGNNQVWVVNAGTNTISRWQH